SSRFIEFGLIFPFLFGLISFFAGKNLLSLLAQLVLLCSKNGYKLHQFNNCNLTTTVTFKSYTLFYVCPYSVYYFHKGEEICVYTSRNIGNWLDSFTIVLWFQNKQSILIMPLLFQYSMSGDGKYLENYHQIGVKFEKYELLAQIKLE
ncbi:hypothetical protein ACJX0J_023928, partial [Zea mays]